MSKRIKLSGPTLRTRAEAETMVGEVRSHVIEESRLLALRDKEHKTVDDRYAATLGQIGVRKEQCTELLQGWAEANPDEFGTLKSLEMTHGRIGWKIGNPTLKTLAGWTWDRTLEKLKQFAQFNRFVRVKEEVDKQALIAERETLGDAEMRSIGVRVVQQETFFIEPKVDEVETRQTAEAK